MGLVQNLDLIRLLICAGGADKLGENIAKSIKKIVVDVYEDTVHGNSTCSYQVTRARLAVSCKTCYQICQISVHMGTAVSVTK